MFSSHEYLLIDIILFIILPILLIPLALFMYYQNEHNVKKYKRVKYSFFILLSIMLLITSLYIIESYRFLSNQEKLLKNSWILSASAYIIVISIFIFSIFLIKIFGNNWLMRRKFNFRRNFGPYLINPKDPSTGMIICGHLDIKKIKRKNNLKEIYLFIRKLDSLNKIKNETQIFKKFIIHLDKTGYFHLKLKNLQSNTQYQYKIPILSKKLFDFKTAPSKEDSLELEQIEFVVLGDMHASGWNISWISDVLNNNLKNIPFIISTGDCVSDGRISLHWRTFLNQIAPFSYRIPINHSTGNHDAVMNKMVEKWKKILPHDFPNSNKGLYHSFYYGFCGFYFLDFYNSGILDQDLSDRQINWLIEELEKRPKHVTKLFIIMHEPMYSTGSQGFNKKLESKLIPIIKKYNVDGYFCGHTHYFELFYREDLNPPLGTIFMISGAAGTKPEGAVYRKLNRPLYLWKSKVHEAKKEFYNSGNKKSLKRNDKYVQKYQEYAVIENHIVHVIVEKNNLTLNVINKQGKTIYKFTT